MKLYRQIHFLLSTYVYIVLGVALVSLTQVCRREHGAICRIIVCTVYFGKPSCLGLPAIGAPIERSGYAAAGPADSEDEIFYV